MRKDEKFVEPKNEENFDRLESGTGQNEGAGIVNLNQKRLEIKMETNKRPSVFAQTYFHGTRPI